LAPHFLCRDCSEVCYRTFHRTSCHCWSLLLWSSRLLCCWQVTFPRGARRRSTPWWRWDTS